MKLSKSQSFASLTTAILVLFSHQLFAGPAILKCSSAKLGRNVVVVGIQAYINKETGKTENQTVISAWIEQLENNFIFSDVRFDAKNGKYLARRNIYKSLARVTIESQKDKVEITFDGKKKTITDAKCSPVTAE